jgi:hypothetical protein
MELNVDSNADDKAVILYPPVRFGCLERSYGFAVVLTAMIRENANGGNESYRVADSMKNEQSKCFWNASWTTCAKGIVKPRSTKSEALCESTCWIALPRPAGSCTCFSASIPTTDASRSRRKSTPLRDWLKRCATRKSNVFTSVSTILPVMPKALVSPVGEWLVHRTTAHNQASKQLRRPCCP